MNFGILRKLKFILMINSISKLKICNTLLFSLVAMMSFISCSKKNYEHFTIQSSTLNETRVINVMLPENYTQSSENFPVLYMLDGGMKEDFPHIAETVSALIKQNKIKPIILVGIENTQRRRDLTGFTTVETDKQVAPEVGGSEKFRAFVKDELFSTISEKYRISEHKSIIGESLAGLFIIETFFTQPDMFDNYIVFDPSLWWNNQYLVNNSSSFLEKFSDRPKRLWMASSDATDIFPHTQKLARSIEELNLPQLKYQYTHFPNEKHQTIFKSTKESALIWSLN